MKKLALLLMAASLAACQATRALPGTGPSTSRPEDSHAAILLEGVPALGSDCSLYDAAIYSDGGKLSLPAAEGYDGYLRYASGSASGDAEFYACPGTDNSFGMPIPRGHTADWFGELRFGFSTVFEQADLYGKMNAQWLPKTDYWMYLYDGQYHHVGSYKIGRANVKKSVLKFPSPFENGLATPADGILYLEIAHRTK